LGCAPELIVTSPLDRAIQTCLLAFPRQDHPDAAYEVWPEHVEHLEAACDIGSPKSVLEERWSDAHLDFSALPAVWWYTPQTCGCEDPLESRTYWKEFGLVEPDESVELRVDQFVARLKERPETRIAVVGHADTFNHFLRRYYRQDKWLANCEVLTVTLTEDMAPPAPTVADPSHEGAEEVPAAAPVDVPEVHLAKRQASQHPAPGQEKKVWSDGENQALLAAVKQNTKEGGKVPKDVAWKAVVEAVPGFTAGECMRHFKLITKA